MTSARTSSSPRACLWVAATLQPNILLKDKREMAW
jgi:hypothetical protein